MHRATFSMLNKPFPTTHLDPEHDPNSQNVDFIIDEREFTINLKIYEDTFDTLAKQFGTERDYEKLMFFYQLAMMQSNNIATLKRTERYMTEKELSAYYGTLKRQQEAFDFNQEDFQEYINKNHEN
ncbi:hypothetical protein [Sphingobacterium sp. LRF_L2]|uniref:hypothetical protein n=1 Tax=Sphingobacterium sp. LRF_L2 TaxID=3369421 RepID=UPI003F6403A9